jgi:SulP family sulfate permease
VAILLVTFGLTVFADLVVAVNVGVLLATLHFLRRMASSVGVQQVSAETIDLEFGRGESGSRLLPLPDGVLVYVIDGPFFFAAVDAFERALAETHTDPETLVIRLGRVPFVDITGIQALEEVIDNVLASGVRVVLCEANARVTSKLRRAGLLARIGGDNVVATFPEALRLVAPREAALAAD